MRYFLAFLVTIALLITLIFVIFNDGGNNGKPRPVVSKKSLASYYNTDAEARMTIDGTVNSNQEHQQMQISVNKNDVTFVENQGYDGKAVSIRKYANTENSYSAFLSALANAGFTKGENNTKLGSESGVCPLGQRYIFQFIQDGKDIERYWATTCGPPQTYLGSTRLTVTLFQAQVPDYDELTNELDL